MKFNDFPYERPDCKDYIQQLEKLAQSFREKNTFPEQLAVFQESERVAKDFSTLAAIAHVRYSINTKDAFYKEECDYFDLNDPLLDEQFLKITQALLDSPFLAQFEEELGAVAIKNLQLSSRSFSPDVVALAQKENELCTQYQTLYASATVEFDGKTMPLPLLGPYKINPDREIRKEAFQVEGQFFDDNQKELEDIFDQLVKNRHEQARILGYENYVALAYDRRRRNCYDAKDVQHYRSQILEEIVPLVRQVKDRQQARIGVETLKFYDDGFTFPDGNPTPKGTPEELLASCRKMYNEMSPETSEFIEFMFEKELFDVISRDGKAPGGYCTSFLNYGAPFIFSNFNGTAGDVDVLTHEAGHALAAYLSRDAKYLSHMSPTADACEVHSMAMEYLTSPWHSLFFQEDTAKYTLNKTASDLSFLPYGTMVDYFQELIYEKPEMTPAQRNELWLSLEKDFRPYMDFDGLPLYARGGGWQRQLHIYLYPFYYIDYCLASTVALKLQSMKLQDAQQAWDTYLTYTKMGGTKTFLDLVTTAGLTSPMEEGCLKSICNVISDWLFQLKV